MVIIQQEGNKRTEVNFLRLLNRCESMFKERSGSTDWRLEKYVGSLVTFLNMLKKMTVNQPRHEDLIDYTRRVDLLKGLMEAEKLASTSLKSLAVDRLVPSKLSHEPFADESDLKVSTATISHQLHVQTKAKCLKNLRDELLGSPDTSLRQRISNSKVIAEEDVTQMMKHHQQLQEKLADEMVSLARNLKENATIAGRIVREDKEKLQKSTTQADDNFCKLKVESERLEYHVQHVCSWWIWIMLGVVVCTFIWMVLFMKLYPKSR